MFAPARPSMPGGPDSPEDRRSQHMAARADLMRDRADDRIKEWLETHIQEERLRHWGAADTSANPLASFSRQASTPGLYVKPPRIRGPAGADVLIGEDGLLSHLWPRMQKVQYFAVGLGSMCVRVTSIGSTGRLGLRLLFPHDLYAVSHPDDPTVPVEIWELGLRDVKAAKAEVATKQWVWDVWSIADRNAPFYRVHLAPIGGELGEDVTAQFLPEGTESFAGKSYPYWRGDNDPVLPHVIYRAHDDGTMWSWELGRGAMRGSLNSMLNWSFAQHAARDASGSTGHAIDAEPVGARQVTDKDGRPSSAVVQSPGTIHRWRTREGSDHQGRIVPMGPGVNLQQLLAYAQAYELNQLTRYGLNPTDITRTNNTPTSGLSIALSNHHKQQLQRQFAPLFRRADRELLERCAIVAQHAGIGTFPTGPYSITYDDVPLTPQERQEQRTDLDWRVQRGLMSEVDLYRELYPGSTSEDAVETIARARVETLVLEQRTRQLAAERGVTITPRDEEPTA